MRCPKSIRRFGLPTTSPLSKSASWSSTTEIKKDPPSVIRNREGSDLIMILRTSAEEWNTSIKSLRTSRHISSSSTAKTRNGKRYRIASRKVVRGFRRCYRQVLLSRSKRKGLPQGGLGRSSRLGRSSTASLAESARLFHKDFLGDDEWLFLGDECKLARLC